MKQTQLILENQFGQVARVMPWGDQPIEVVFCLDNRRLELVANTSELERLNRPFKKIAQVTPEDLIRKPLKMGKLGRLRQAQTGEDLTLSPSQTWSEEENLDLMALTKWTTLAHVGTVLAIMLVAFFFKPTPNIEDQIIYITEQKRVEPRPRQTVKMSETRVRPIPKNNQARVADRTTRPKQTQHKTTQRPTPKKAVTQRPRDVSKMGALGALGGTQSGSRTQGGLNPQARNNSAGSGSSGWGGVGGVNATQPGRGIVASKVGNNAKAQGAGGYGTRGKGGGRPGYGATQFAGVSGGYTLPLEEEALIQGGLDRDQIAAVIQRNIGQIIYCYEQGLQTSPSLSGRVTMDFVIGGNGRVRTAQVANTSLRSQAVENCIAGRLRNWTFPQPKGQVDVKVSYPFVLRRVGQG